MTATTSSSHVEVYDQSKYWVSPARNFRSSARLHLQHLLIQNTIGYLLEPAIEKSVVDPQRSQQLKVADLACGNGIWLSELHSTLTRVNISAQLDGFDINPINFPDPAHLPTSMSLRELDILARPLPAELVGVYGIVHIRAFVSVIPDADLTPVLSVASQLLKPGGSGLKGGLQARGIRNDWVDVLDTHLGQYGFQGARQHRHGKRRQDLKGWT